VADRFGGKPLGIVVISFDHRHDTDGMKKLCTSEEANGEAAIYFVRVVLTYDCFMLQDFKAFAE